MGIGQNILNFYGTYVDVRLDSSEYYDLELTNDDFDGRLMGNTNITSDLVVADINLAGAREITSLSVSDGDEYHAILDFDFFVDVYGENYRNTFLISDRYQYQTPYGVTILDIVDVNEPPIGGNVIKSSFIGEPVRETVEFETNGFNIKPFAQQIKKEEHYLYDLRHPRGYTMEFLFNKTMVNWPEENVFFYMGVRGDDTVENYAGNSLSFGFTERGTVKCTSTILKDFCEDRYETLSVETPPIDLPPKGKFVLNIVFERYHILEGCDLLNKGGRHTFNKNDQDGSEMISMRYFKDQKYRMGDLKIYCNGRKIAEFPFWEETVMARRGLQPYIMSWGGGTGLMNGQHTGICPLDLQSVKYYKEPLSPIYLKHNIKTLYS